MVMMTERIEPQDKLIASLERVPLSRMYQASFRAVVRLHLYFTGRTHELMLDFVSKAKGSILRSGETLDGGAAYALQSDLMRMWGDTWTQWSAEFQQARRESGRIAFGAAAVTHNRLIVPEVSGLDTSRVERAGMPSQRALNEATTDGVFDPQLRILLEVAERYLYGDGINLSDRIWRIEREAREGINTVILNGIQSGDSAWNIAKQLEQFVGANADCPRWTSTRLYGRTKSDIAAGDTTGLLRGTECDGSGVSYNALRLARTEIQKIHSLATDQMMAIQPWVLEEQIHLSAAHPEEDICDEIVGSGRDGQGIYEKGEIELPLHPNCLCYKTAVMMERDQFISDLKGWMNGTQEWAGMDAYASELGVDVSTDLTPSTLTLAVWMFSNKLEDWLK
jgi:hypothetical protein